MNISKSSPDKPGKDTQSEFDIKALDIFRIQAQENDLYSKYISTLGIDYTNVSSIEDIPFLPIEFFKSHMVKTGSWYEEKVFESSGTTGSRTSRHYIKDLSYYHETAQRIFENEFGSIKEKVIIGLLPSYLERQSSSLVSMVDYFIKLSANPNSGFYLDQTSQLVELIIKQRLSQPIFLFGVTFALLDLAEQYELDLSHVTVIETGGMKGRREEIIKEEVYKILQDRLRITQIYTEYGMTELQSQSYGYQGRMRLPDSMQVLIRDVNDPYAYLNNGKTGGINIIDLANRDSCSFIETKDLGRINEDLSFEILGRFDNSDIRGCNLMLS